MKENLSKIINHYGVSNQLKHFNEEVFELTQAIVDYEWFFYERGIDDKNHITEEIGDCLNFIEQFIGYYKIDENKILMSRLIKIDRTLYEMENNIKKEDRKKEL